MELHILDETGSDEVVHTAYFDCVIYIYTRIRMISMHVTDPVVHVRVWWITGNTKRPSYALVALGGAALAAVAIPLPR